ncbi:MAG: ATP-binding protein [Candidatus Taylorbacteria bacterium]|nr:ATP-binding protein [Candidatus Taylorbacteria bacterium]
MHRALERQIKRYIGNLSVPPELSDFLEAVSQTYAHFDEDRTLLDRSLELSSKEFTGLNRRLDKEKDIVEQKVKERTLELEYEKKKLYEITQNMSMGAILLNSRGDVIFVNKVAENILGCSNLKPDEVLPKFYKTFSSVSLTENMHHCLAGEPSEVSEVEYGDKIFQILFRCIFSDNATREHLIWIQDITVAKMLERSKNEFVAIASHEMRTPLAIIRGQVELLYSQPSIKSGPGDVVGKLNSIHNNSVRLLNIVNDFLDLTWLEEKRIQFKQEKFDLVKTLKEVLSDVMKIAEQKNVQVKFNEPKVPLPNVLADRERVLQVITNLVANALHYTEKGSVTIGIEKDGSDHLKVFIKDTGIGIEPTKKGMLFQKFQIAGKVFMQSQEYGSGIGLYITKLLIEQMGGRVKLEESEVGKGSTFSFTVLIAN